MIKLNDAIIRAALRRTLEARAKRAKRAIVLDEFSLSAGRTRADLVVVNGHLAGYEIKSDCDTLERLPEQMRLFNPVFDRMTIVVGWRYAAQAMRLVPSWWGIKLAEFGARGSVRFSTLRVTAQNPSQDASALASLLWREEAVAAASLLDLGFTATSQRKRVLVQHLAARLSRGQLRKTVCGSIKRREAWRVAAG